MRAHRVLSHGLAGLGAAMACACGQTPAPDGYASLGRSHQAIIDGYVSPDADDAVVRTSGQRGCTATLIAPNLLITAMHCLTDLIGDGQFECSIQGELLDPPNGEIGLPYDPESIAVYAGQAYTNVPVAVGSRILSTRATHICQKDLAFLVLDRSLDDLPIAPVRLDAAVARYEKLDVVGYGLTQLPPIPGQLAERRRRDAVPVEAVGRLNGQPEGTYYARPNTFALGESVCMGDSGGPALSSTGAVVGVYSTNSVDCHGDFARNFFTLASQFRPLVLEAFEAAGATPFIEGQLRPGVWPDAGAPAGDDDDAGAPQPAERLDAGGLTPLDSSDSDPPVEVRRPDSSRRVDSGFCSLEGSAARGAPSRSLAWLSLLALAGALRRRGTPRS